MGSGQDGCIKGWRCKSSKGQFGVNVGHPIVTNGDCGVVIFSAVRDGDGVSNFIEFRVRVSSNFSIFSRIRNVELPN